MTTKFYVTKYASTKGIQEHDAFGLPTTVGEDGAVTAVEVDGKTFKMGKAVFASLDEARMDAIKRTRKKVSLLVEKEAKLEDVIVAWESELPQ